MLELGKALSFFLCIASLYSAAISAFFVQGTDWQDRLILALPRLALAAAACFLSGLIFTWPSRTNPKAGRSLLSTLPVRLFLWGSVAITLAFCLSWYLIANAPCVPGVNHSCYVT